MGTIQRAGLTEAGGADRMTANEHGQGGKNTLELRALAQDLGFDLFGVADVTSLRADFLLEPETRDRFGLAVSLGKRLSDARPR